MTQQQIAIEMPQHASYGEIMKAYFSIMRGFGLELGLRCDSVLSAADGSAWWAELVEQRRAEGQWRGQVNLYDPSITLPEYVWAKSSPLGRVLSPKPESRKLAKMLHLARNSWLHFSEAPGPEELESIVGLLKQFASFNALKIQAPAERMIRRLQRIRSGQYQPYGEVIERWRAEHAAPIEEPSAAAAEPTAPVEDLIDVDAPAEQRRPPIGARWTGEIPRARFLPSSTGDLVDPASGISLRTRVDPAAWSRKRRLWLAPRPLGGVWVDDRDGAVGGFVDNVPRLLGFLAAEPSDGAARGFLLPRFYEVLDGRLVDIESGHPLADVVPEERRAAAIALEGEVVAASPERSGIRVSTYGDVVVITGDGVRRVAEVEPAQWFPGHLE